MLKMIQGTFLAYMGVIGHISICYIFFIVVLSLFYVHYIVIHKLLTFQSFSQTTGPSLSKMALGVPQHLYDFVLFEFFLTCQQVSIIVFQNYSQKPHVWWKCTWLECFFSWSCIKFVCLFSVPARNWKWRGATLEKGHFSTSKTKGNIVIFSYLS